MNAVKIKYNKHFPILKQSELDRLENEIFNRMRLGVEGGNVEGELVLNDFGLYNFAGWWRVKDGRWTAEVWQEE